MYSEIEKSELINIKNLEPDKCEKWIWITITQMRLNTKYLFYPLQDFLNNHPEVMSIENLKGMIKAPLFFINYGENFIKNKLTNKNISPNKSSDSTFEEDMFITKEDLYLEYAL